MVNQFRTVFSLFLSCLLFACALTQPVPPSVQQDEAASFIQKIITIDKLIEDENFNKARRQQALLTTTPSPLQEALQHYSQANLAFAEQEFQQSKQWLNHKSVESYLIQADDAMAARIHLLQAKLLEHDQQFLSAARLRIYLATLLEDENTYQANHLAIWQALKHVEIEDKQIAEFSHEQDLQQWLQLLSISQKSYASLDQQIQAITLWLQHSSQHPAAKNPPADIALFIQVAESRPKKVAIILPFDGKYRHHGSAIRDGIIHAWYHSSYQPELSFYSFNEGTGFSNVYHEALYDGAEMIIGPLFKEQLAELYQLGDVLPVPTIALNRLDPELAKNHIPPLNLIEFSLSSEDEIDSLISLALAEKKHRALIIYQQDAWAIKAAEYFQQQWQAAGQMVINSIGFASTREQSPLLQQALQTDRSQQRARELQWLTGLKLHSEPRARKDVDMIFLVSRPEAAASLRPLLSFHYAGDIPVFANSSVYRGYPNPAIDNDLSHIVFSDAPLLIEPDQNISSSYQNTPYIRVFALGLDTFMLIERAKLLQMIESLSLQGASGELSIEQQLIKRKTAYGQFSRGKIVAVKPPKIEQDAENHDNTDDR